MSRTDPFVDLSSIDIKYVPGYENVILDADREEDLATKKTEQLTYFQSLYNTGAGIVSKAPMYLLFGAVIPIGAVAYLANSGIQTYRSAQRIRMHEEGNLFGSYRLPLMIEDVQRGADLAMENMAGSQSEEYLPKSTEKTAALSAGESGATTSKEEAVQNEAGFPILALTRDQFDMIDNLVKLGFDRYAVHIQKASHSHAAIVVRTNRAAFTEGKIVFRHWTERFEL